MKLWRLAGLFFFSVVLFVSTHAVVDAANLSSISNRLSDSGPSEFSNHSYVFNPVVALGPNAYIDISLPADFTVTAATTTFDIRNVELYVDGVARTADAAPSPGIDGVSINRSSPGSIRYTLAPDAFISANRQYELRVGNNTSGSLDELTTFSTSTGTTTRPADIEPIRNSATLGVHEMELEIVDGTLVADGSFVVFLNRKVTIPVDTTETVPPLRFNPAPTSTVGGTTLSVEISLETNELAICRYDVVAGTDYNSMTQTFSNTGFLEHSTVVAITPDSLQQFFVRCIDDEDNFNIDDFVIEFVVSAQPTGTSNTDGNVSGDGSGSGDDGTGDGSGGGGTSGSSDGEEPLEGGDTGTGGSGGGGGGGSGGNSGSTGGGGFEGVDAPFESGDGQVIISGTAYPGADVYILVDGQAFESTRANSDGVYSITINDIARGAYTFGVYAVDSTDDRSGTFSTSFTVSGSRASRLSNINITPTITVTPDPAEPGEILTISGYALPDATLTVEVERDDGSNTQTLTAVSDSDGRWTTTLDTTGFPRDTYRVRALAEQLDGDETNFSDYEFFGLGQEADLPLSPDLNRDGFVNLIDFSILLFWWQSDGGDSDPPADINQDGNVSLTDFSILLFNWTG